jgi:type IV pilus assembly protein PilY1
MKRFLTALTAAAAVLVAYVPSQAEDIDLFVQPPGEASGLPNVLIVLDNTANWNQAFTNEIKALVDTVNGLPTGTGGAAKYRVGLMLFTETGSPNNNIDGGYVRAAIRNMDSANKTKYMALLNNLDKGNDVSNGGKAGVTMAEAYQYYSALAPYAGNNKVKTDYTGNSLAKGPKMTVAGAKAANDVYALAGNALNSRAGSPYNSPLVDGSCAGNYIIYISNGAPSDNNSLNGGNKEANDRLQAAATAAGISGATTPIKVNPAGSQDNVADEWARFMKKSPRAITTYTLDVDKVLTGQGPGWTAILKSMAGVSRGKYFDVSSGNGGAQVAAALGRIFSEIQAVNSVFASVSLPVSVNTEGTYLNQVYIGMFRPDQDGFPRWAGNLKQYKLALSNNGTQLRTVDADGQPAINSETGFITECARSHWTPTTKDSYWEFRPQGGCKIGDVSYDDSNFPDGRTVEKGAQGYVLRASTARTLTTCSSTFALCSTAGALLDFDSVTAAMLGVGTANERNELVNWAKGLDVDDENINGNPDLSKSPRPVPTEMRPSAHGDVVHSRPVAVNYGTDASPKVVVFYASNDGVLKAINGNREAQPSPGPNNNIGSITPGKEIWSFVAPEFFSNIKRLRDNSTQISFKGNPTTSPAPLPKPYGMDGAISIYNNTNLYVGMRRGGRALYAFDVTDIVAATPKAPRLLWKRGCPVNLTGSGSADDTGCSSGYSGLGQTWSAPKIIKAAGYKDGSNVPKPMIIMGGGYDPCEDADPASGSCKSGEKGKGVFLIDAADGTLISVFATDRAVIGDVAVVTDDETGLAQWAYVADLGGNVYRISTADGATNNSLPIGSTAPVGWAITKIASLGCASPSDNCSANRKFMFKPSVVEKNGTMYLLLGSGDREKPLDDTYWPNSYEVENYFFMIKDMPMDKNWLKSEKDNCVQEVICKDSLLAIPADSTPDAADLADVKGWYLPLNDHEQVVTSAITVFGNTTFSTHTPAKPKKGACTSNLGDARVYNVGYKDAAPRANNDRSEPVSGGGLPPSPVAGKVTLDDGTTVPFIIGAEGSSPLEGGAPTQDPAKLQPKSLTYWYIEK